MVASILELEEVGKSKDYGQTGLTEGSFLRQSIKVRLLEKVQCRGKRIKGWGAAASESFALPHLASSDLTLFVAFNGCFKVAYLSAAWRHGILCFIPVASNR